MAEIVLGSKLRGLVSGAWLSQRGLSQSEIAVPSKEITVLASILILIQLLDGLFTGIGVNLYGSTIEANPIIRGLIESWGHIQALVFIKSIAIMIIFGLTALSTYVEWMPRAMRVVICIYVVSALVPWSLILIRHI